MHKYGNTNNLTELLKIKCTAKTSPGTENILQDCFEANYICWTLKFGAEIIRFITKKAYYGGHEDAIMLALALFKLGG